MQSDSLCYTSGHIANGGKQISETILDIFCLFCFGKGMHCGKLVWVDGLIGPFQWKYIFVEFNLSGHVHLPRWRMVYSVNLVLAIITDHNTSNSCNSKLGIPQGHRDGGVSSVSKYAQMFQCDLCGWYVVPQTVWNVPFANWQPIYKTDGTNNGFGP